MTPKITKTAILAISILLTAQLMTTGAASAGQLGTMAQQSSAYSSFGTTPTQQRGAHTCDQSGETGCDLDTFIYLCEKGGGGGMSTEPGGGVTCDLPSK